MFGLDLDEAMREERLLAKERDDEMGLASDLAGLRVP